MILRQLGSGERRRRGASFAVTIALVVVGSTAQSSTADPSYDRQGTVQVGTTYEWLGALASGANVTYDPVAGSPCGKTAETRCDVTLIQVTEPATTWTSSFGELGVRINNLAPPNPASDLNVYVYASDPAGTRGTLLGSSEQPAGLPELMNVRIDTSAYFLVQVVYRAAVQSRYLGTVALTTTPRPPGSGSTPPVPPPDVDVPAGIQESLASNPALGFRSHSEPHIAQSPTDPDVLVAGSKQYNRDPDSLAEYEFKIGTYVSFDHGATWTDLGQLDVCPAAQAPPASWPNQPCYPDEDEARDGTGGEDGSRGGGGDWGEEYIVSDVWVNFDDEGNAYVMVLDAPPGGSGWGMTMHRWDSVAPEDLVTGETWSHRIPINTYADPATRSLVLDDKNTFAVNNAGPDGDGNTGVMVACWGQAIGVPRIVCESSFDGGRSWPLAPITISPVQTASLGVHVVADPHEPLTFYATWAEPVTGEIAFAKSVTGGLTWVRMPPSLFVNMLPRQFPSQNFRNHTLPIMATGPDGELYITYAAYALAPEWWNDEDGWQADVFVVRSDDGGSSWQKKNVTWWADEGMNVNADQFQPYIAVAPDGRIDVAYFDRRMDPANYYVDVWLSRSVDGGGSYTHTRLSHELGDPEYNAPVSSSGLFFGDYQGLVADDCGAVAFFNDTHTLYPASRDPDFDQSMPRSSYQEVFSWAAPAPC